MGCTNEYTQAYIFCVGIVTHTSQYNTHLPFHTHITMNHTLHTHTQTYTYQCTIHTYQCTTQAHTHTHTYQCTTQAHTHILIHYTHTHTHTHTHTPTHTHIRYLLKKTLLMVIDNGFTVSLLLPTLCNLQYKAFPLALAKDI